MFYTLSITLQNRKPLNQRVIRIKDNQTFEDLSNIICELYGFTGEHLREFRDDDALFINHPDFNTEEQVDLDFSDPEFLDLQWIPQNVSSRKFTLAEFFHIQNNLIYVYDFGENWRFEIKKISQDEGMEIGAPIQVISGTGSYLMDDCGGTEGLKEYLDQYAHQQWDGDWRETRLDFAEWIQPATRQFDIKKHV